jgi:hypothetical protein
LRRTLASLLCALAFQATAAAHALDEYVQAAQVALAPGGARVELRLTPGVFVADRVYALIDVDGDGRLSAAEEQAYARRVLQDLSLEVDGRRVPLRLEGVEYPSRREMKEGVGRIRLDLAAEAALDAAGEHRLSFRNDHLPEVGAYLANVLAPATDAFRIDGQQRDALQHELRVDFQVLTPGARARPLRTAALLSGLCLALLFTQRRRLRSLLAPARR